MRTGSRAAEPRLVIPPLDCMTKMRGRAVPVGEELRARRSRFSQIALHHRLQISVHHDRAGAFVFAELGKNLVRDRERYAKLFQRSWRRHSQSSDWRRRTAAKLQLPRGAFREVCSPATAGPAATALAGFRRHWRCVPSRRSANRSGTSGSIPIEKEIVELRARLAADLDGIFKTGGCDQATRAPLRCSRVLVPTVVPCRRISRTAQADLFQGFDDRSATGRPAWRRPSACGSGRARSRHSR